MDPDKIQLQNLPSPSEKTFNVINKGESDLPEKQIKIETFLEEPWDEVTFGHLQEENLISNNCLIKSESINPKQELLSGEQSHNCSLKKPYDEQHPPLGEGQLHDYLSLARETPAGDIRTEESGRTQECVLQWEKLLQKRNHQIDSANTNLLLTAENAESLQRQNGDPIYGTDPRRKRVRLDNVAERRRQRAALKRQQETPEQRAIRRERDRLQVKFARMEESAEQRQLRLETNRVAVKERRQRETSDERVARLLQNRVFQNTARLSETPEQRQLRLLKVRLRMTAHRQRETAEARETRLRKTRERMMAFRNGKTSNRQRVLQEQDQIYPEAAAQPLRQQNKIGHALERDQLTVYQSQYNQELCTFSHAIVQESDEYNARHQRQYMPGELQNIARMAESAEQRQIRLETSRIAVKERRQRETSDERAARLLQNRIFQTNARLCETPEQRELRLLKVQQGMTAHRQRETAEERETRLRKTRERMRALRNGKTSNRQRVCQERDQINHEAPDEPMRQQNTIRHALERDQLTVDQSQYTQEQRTASHATVRGEADEYNERHQSQNMCEKLEHIASATPTSIHLKDSADTDPPWKLHAHSAASYCETQITLPSKYYDDSGQQRIKTEFQSDDSGDFVCADMIGNSPAKCLSNIYSESDIKSEFVDVNDIKLWP